MDTNDRPTEKGMEENAVDRRSPHPDADAASSTRGLTPVGIRSSPPNITDRPPMIIEPVDKDHQDDSATKSDSEAETIVLPGKDGYSPSKIRKTIKHEDESGDERLHGTTEADGSSKDEATKSTLGKRKRTKSGTALDEPLGHSSGLSSVPSSPIRTSQSSRSRQAGSNSVVTRSPSPTARDRSKARSVDRQSRESGELDSSEDDSDTRRRGDYRGASSNQKKQLRGRSEAKPKSEGTFRSRDQSRSASPPWRGHRRSVSTQNANKGTNGLSQKKKRVPAPLLATRERQSSEYHSDDSEISGSTQQRSSRLRKLATPATGDSATSNTARMPTHKKHRDNIGRTPLARACSQLNYEDAKAKLDAHPEDIDIADYAGNTPLQIASLEGEVEIVKLLIDRGCDIHCINTEKETPLHDAVENDHLEVVKLLIDAGVNPNRGNINGEEPLDKVPEENDNAEEIKEALRAAKVKWSKLRRASEDKAGHDDERRPVFDSPRHTPPVQFSEGIGGRRGANQRAEKTSNELLYIPHDLKTLRTAAGQGDAERVMAVLNVMQNINDPESSVAAARGGHDVVLNLIFALSNTVPDPKPIASMPWEVSTPMLAAIGRENSLEVIRLLLESEAFNPMQKYEGKTYYEIAKQRAGPLWKDEERLLKDAYEKYKSSSPKALRSPDRRRDDRKRLRGKQPERSPPPRSHKRKLSGERGGDPELRKRSASENKHDDRSKSTSKRISSDNQTPQKRGPGRPRKDDRGLPGDDRIPPTQEAKRLSQKKPDADAAAVSSDNDNHKARRRLISGRDLKGEKDKHRRPSIASTNLGESTKEKSHSSENSKGDAAKPRLLSSNPEPEPARDRALDRARSQRREESKDRLSAIRGDSPVKRPRSSATPPRSDSVDSPNRRADDSGIPAKRRRLTQGNGDDRMDDVRSSSPVQEDSKRRPDNQDNHNRKRQNSLPAVSKAFHVPSADGAKSDITPNIKREVDSDVVMSSSKPTEMTPRSKAEASSEKEAQTTKKEAITNSAYTLSKDDVEMSGTETKREKESQPPNMPSEIEARVTKDVKEAKDAREVKEAREAQEAKVAKEAKDAQEAREKEEQERMENARKERLAREEAALEEELRQKQELAERQERQKREDAEAKEKAEAENKKLYLEQQRLRQQEEARKRSAREAERERQAELAELARLAKLPKLLRWFDALADPKIPEVAYRFTTMTGVRYSTINPDDTTNDGKEQWVLNTQVALLLGIKDIQLSQYTAWQRVPATVVAKQAIWHIEADRYCMTDPMFRDCCDEDDLSMQRRAMLRDENKPLFFALDLFFVKLSDLMYIVQSTRYLMDVDLRVTYSELPINGQDVDHWKNDPGAGAFVVPSTTWRGGRLVGEQREQPGRISDKPFPLQRDPRRGTTFIPVPRDDPEYERLAREQGLTYLLPDSPNTDEHANNVAVANMIDANGFTPSPTVSSNNVEDQLSAGVVHQSDPFDDSERQLPNGYPE